MIEHVQILFTHACLHSIFLPPPAPIATQNFQKASNPVMSLQVTVYKSQEADVMRHKLQLIGMSAGDA